MLISILRGVPCRVLARAAILLTLVAAVQSQTSQPRSTADPSQRDMLGEYCVGCHNNQLRTAGISLQQLNPAAAARDAALCEKVLPAAANPNPGRPGIHRLNRAEHSNAVRDLLDLDIDPGASFPVDDSGYGFDNIADVLTVSPSLPMSVAENARMDEAVSLLTRLVVNSGGQPKIPSKR